MNNIYNSNLIEVGQELLIPPPSYEQIAPDFKIIPDSELVYSPGNAGFNMAGFVQGYNGYLSVYSGVVDDIAMSGEEILERVATEYSVNPRLLLAVLEYQSGWVRNPDPEAKTLVYPMLFYESGREGLYKQLAWAANLLNEGYYLWKLNAITAWLLSDFSVVLVDPTINPGEEDASWQRLHDEAIDKFLAGQYTPQYEKALIDDFQAHLPELPPWKR